MIIAPSVLTADLSNLEMLVKPLMRASLHLDVMDGNLSMPLALRYCKLRQTLGPEPFFDAPYD